MNRHDDLDLRSAFPEMPAECRAALSHAARSVREEEHVRRKLPVVILVTALLTLMTTFAFAEGWVWNVLDFLGLGPDSGASALVQPVSAAARADNVSFRIDSAITDGDYLAFDWTVENTNPELPVFLQIEQFTANGERLWHDPNDSFDCMWLPGWSNDGTMQGGELIELPNTIDGDTLAVEMVIGVYTPEQPVFYLNIDSIVNEVDADLVRRKWAEGYYVLESSGEGFIIDDPEDGPKWVWSGVNEQTRAGLVRGELTVRFALDLKAARAATRELPLPEPVTANGATLTLTSATVTPLQTRLNAIVTCESSSRETIPHWAHRDEFILTDRDGNELDLYSLCASPFGEVSVQENADGSWYRQWDFTLLDLSAAMPEEIVLSYRLDEQAHLADGTPLPEGMQLDLTIPLK